ncbi:MAG: hypothetical protein ACRCZK_01790 [Oscillospiraceae bacterium]
MGSEKEIKKCLDCEAFEETNCGVGYWCAKHRFNLGNYPEDHGCFDNDYEETDEEIKERIGFK